MATPGFKMKYPIIKDYLPIGTKRRSGKVMPSVEFDVSHDTGNPGSTAKGNVGYYRDSANTQEASAHIFADDKEIRECVPLLTGTPEKAWHNRYNTPMDNKMYGFDANDRAASVELCWGGKINFEEAYKRYVWVNAYICYKFGLNPAKDIVGHEILDPGRKIDPSNGLKSGGKTSKQFVADVVKEYNECKGIYGDAVVVSPVKSTIPEVYTIKKGDSYWRIANTYDGLSVDDLMNFNKGVDHTDLKIGQVIRLKAVAQAPVAIIKTENYIIKKGDTFWGIANKTGSISMQDLISMNPNVDPTNLQVGQSIIIKKSTVSAPVAAPVKAKPVAPKIKYPLNKVLLKKGSKGQDVINLQNALCAVHFYPDKNAKNNGVDGIFGNDTVDALKRFQTVHVGTADGIFGEQSRSKLYSLANK